MPADGFPDDVEHRLLIWGLKVGWAGGRVSLVNQVRPPDYRHLPYLTSRTQMVPEGGLEPPTRAYETRALNQLAPAKLSILARSGVEAESAGWDACLGR